MLDKATGHYLQPVGEGISIGFRIKWGNSKNDIKEGFVTTGHNLEEDQPVWYFGDKIYRVGTVEKITMNEKVDLALVELNQGVSITKSTSNGMTYNSLGGKIEPYDTVYGFGGETEYVTGYLEIKDFEGYQSKGFTFEFEKVHILRNMPMQEGDSGGAILYQQDAANISLIGIVQGGEGDIVIAIPFEAIDDYLSEEYAYISYE